VLKNQARIIAISLSAVFQSRAVPGEPSLASINRGVSFEVPAPTG